ncbi:MAG: LPS-assembly protein LptD [Candidatus Hydrogenedentota bacterium]|nr:MAG: LPS-assembly protein LptD [Candidatus Hydrogenedentota bacterium]
MIASLLILSLLAAGPRMVIEADSSTYDAATGRFHLTGNVAVTRLGAEGDSSITLLADRMEGVNGGEIAAVGNVVVLYGDREAHAARGRYDQIWRTGEFEDVDMVADSWFLDARRLTFSGSGRYSFQDLELTTCDYLPPHYRFRASHGVFKNGRLTLYNARMLIGKVPVFWLPYISVPVGAPRPPFRLQLGKTNFEGYYAKLTYLYDLGRFGQGGLKLDYRSRRGWGGGVEHTFFLPRGSIDLDLYGIDERGRGKRNVIRPRYRQTLDGHDRWRVVADYYKVSDAQFLQDYRFRDFTSKPEPVSFGAVTYRGDAKAFMVRGVGNPNRGKYEVTERMPEVRALFLPRRLPGGLYVEGEGNVTLFRTTLPYLNDTALRLSPAARATASLKSFARAGGEVTVKRPTPFFGRWTVTPYAGLMAMGYTEVDSRPLKRVRFLPRVGMTIGNFFLWNLGKHTRYMIRPVVDVSDRSIHGPAPGQTPVVDHIDLVRDERPVKVILDQGLFRRSAHGWAEKLRVRLDGGIDLDRMKGSRYLPIHGKVELWWGRESKLLGDLEYDPNIPLLTSVRAVLFHKTRLWEVRGNYYLQRGEFGLEDLENVGGDAAVYLLPTLKIMAGGSYDLEDDKLDFVRYGIEKTFHDWIVGIQVTDQRLVNRLDFNVNVQLRLP